MTSPLTPAEIETLRNNIRKAENVADSLAILDRLSPPAREVDEATVWTRKVLATWTLGDLKVKIACGDKDENEDFMNVRQALSELIASKDAEIELERGRFKIADEEVDNLRRELVAVRAEKADFLWRRRADYTVAELATLQAENERLRDTLNTLGTRWALRKAAERNPAGPLVSLASGEPKIGGWTSDAKYAPNEPAKTHVWPATHDDACSEIKATEMTPDVVVTQADCQREQWARNIASYTEGQARNHVYECAINLLTEAEARGRLEALEEMRVRIDACETKVRRIDLIAFIQRMMTGGK